MTLLCEPSFFTRRLISPGDLSYLPEVLSYFHHTLLQGTPKQNSLISKSNLENDVEISKIKFDKTMRNFKNNVFCFEFDHFYQFLGTILAFQIEQKSIKNRFKIGTCFWMPFWIDCLTISDRFWVPNSSKNQIKKLIHMLIPFGSPLGRKIGTRWLQHDIAEGTMNM